MIDEKTYGCIARYVLHACRKYGVMEWYDDVYQDALLAAVKALRDFDPTRSKNAEKRARWIASKEANRSAKKICRRKKVERTWDFS